MHRAALLLIFLTLALLLLWSPAAAKIIVEPAPPELPTDGINVDDERFVPVWQAYSPLEFLTIML
ncbi:MAG: transcriptional regulator, partial [Candidatus Methanoculleus thermohydrogenotrophicum]